MSRKAQGLSLNTIIIAVIVLVVLLIILGIFTGYFKSWKLKFGAVSDTSCKGQGGEERDNCNTGEAESGATDLQPGKVCCVPQQGRKKCTELTKSGLSNGKCVPAIASCSDAEPGGDWSCSSDEKCCH